MLSVEAVERPASNVLTNAELEELAYYDRLGDEQIVRLDEGDKARFRGLVLAFMAS